MTDDIAEASFLVTGIEEGSASITFTADSISGTSTVSVIAPKTIALESTSFSIKEHQSAAVTTTVKDANGDVMAGSKCIGCVSRYQYCLRRRTADYR